MSEPRIKTKDDVQTHYGSNRPAVNIKIYKTFDSLTFPVVDTDPGLTWEWIEQNVSEEALDELFWHMCSFEFEMIEQDAHMIFGDHVKVEQDGRMGGWAVVTGLPDIEEWDAVMLAKWRKFAKYARQIADGVLEQTVISIYLNEFESWRNDQIEDAGLHRDPVEVAQ